MATPDTLSDLVTDHGGPRVGTRIGHFELIEPLGRGGMGQVWKARDTQGQRDVALKLLPDEFRGNREAIAEVQQVFQVVHGLTHQHIGKVLALLEDERHGPYLVMDYVPGITLSEFRKQFPNGRMPLEVAIHVLRPIAEALDYAHTKVFRFGTQEQRGVLHRDVKPQNILVVLDDGQRVREVSLIDFGLAAEIRNTVARNTQWPIDARGTRPYMSPEQLHGNRAQWDGRTDQYSLAVVAYELLAGHLPYDAYDEFALSNLILNDTPTPIADGPHKINAALLRALAKVRDERFPSCGEFVNSLALGKPKAPRSTQVFRVPSNAQPTIQSAIDAALDGDQILVSPGTYNEQIMFKNGIVLWGDDAEKCVIRLQPGKTCALRAENVSRGVIGRLTFQGEVVPPLLTELGEVIPDGIQLVNSSVRVERCIVRSFPGRGIVVLGSTSKALLTNNTCESNTCGIWFGSGAGYRAEHNISRANKVWGIKVANFGTEVWLNQNFCEANRDGIQFDDAATGYAMANYCRMNEFSGITISGAATAPTLIMNRFHGNSHYDVCFAKGAVGDDVEAS